MSNFFHLTLDTTGPANPSVTIEGGAIFATNQLVTLTIGTTDGSTLGYQMRIWGNVDTAYDTDVQGTEGASAWITYQTSKQVRLSGGDGNKSIFVRIRDDVWNQSGQASDSIILDQSLPVVSIAGPDLSRISKITGRNVSSFSFQVNEGFVEYKVKVVSATGAAHDTGVVIGTANGSTNMAATGTYAPSTPIACSINGTDLEIASAGDGSKIIKVFVRDASGLWSA